MSVTYVDKTGLTYFVGKVKDFVSASITNNAVKYSASQSLTSDNKTQARSNLGIDYTVTKVIGD